MIESEDFSWYPREKINFAKRKLKGANPAYVTRFAMCNFIILVINNRRVFADSCIRL